MSIEDYKKHAGIIKANLPHNKGYVLYLRLLEIFVQDAALPGLEPYYGNNTIIKAKILMDLQSHFLSVEHLIGKIHLVLVKL